MKTTHAFLLAGIMSGLTALAPAQTLADPGVGAVSPPSPLHWTGWGADLFKTAKAQNKLVILDLEAVWCHWCHVMARETYGNATVAALIAAKYTAVRVDQDANPDLSSRYGDWGWPATIIFAPDGTELVKLRGYVEPDRMAKLLQAVIDDPTPGPSALQQDRVGPSKDAFVGASRRADLKATFDDSFDDAHGGWGGQLRYIDADSMDYEHALAEDGDKQAEARVRKTLDAATALIDPVWGGVSQYSDNGDWTSPHYEKIMSYQAQYLRQYSEAYARWRDPAYLTSARAIANYLLHVLRAPDGGFATSQDADLDQTTTGHVYYKLDDAGRRKLGVPRIDTHEYAREAGWAARGLLAYHDATGDEPTLAAARRAIAWAKTNRALPGGGFRHGSEDRGGPFLGDTLAMGQAFLALYAAAGDRDAFKDAMAAGDYIGATFQDPDGGFVPTKTSEARAGTFSRATTQIDDQIAVARFMSLLAHYTGKSAYRTLAEQAMRSAVGATLQMERPLPGLLLADRELAHQPTHVTIVGHKDDEHAALLHSTATALPFVYKRIDWWDTREGPLYNQDIGYPELDRPAAFACGERTCSLPVFDAVDLTNAVTAMTRRDLKHAPATEVRSHD